MPFPPLARRFLAFLPVAGMTLVADVAAQTIQRCEGAGRRIVYSNAECPPGTRAVRLVAPAPSPSAQAQKEARARAQRDREVAKALEARRRATPVRPVPSLAYVPVEEARRAADCAYLQAELESNRRMRAMLTTRRYYAIEDVEQIDARDAGLAADYRRFCTR